jgi:DNA mismatch repair ATPase MutS
MSKILNLKLCNLTHNILKCGFPYSSIDKYMNILHNLNYNVEIIDSTTNSIFNYNTYENNSKIRDFLNTTAQLKVEELSISQTYDTLSRLKNEANEILRGLH